jgi:hypothetical protein
MSKRVIMRIELTPAAKDKLQTMTEARGMTQVAVMSRMTEWFAGQPETIQALIMGHYPTQIRGDVVGLILQHAKERS